MARLIGLGLHFEGIGKKMAAPDRVKIKRGSHGRSRISTDEILLELKRLSVFGFRSGGKLHHGILSQLVWNITGGKLIEEI